MFCLHVAWWLQPPSVVAAPLAYTSCGPDTVHLWRFGLPVAIVLIATFIAAKIWFSGGAHPRLVRLGQLVLFAVGGWAWVLWTFAASVLALEAYSLATSAVFRHDFFRYGVGHAVILVALAVLAVALLEGRPMREHMARVAGDGPSPRRVGLMVCQALSSLWLPLAIMLVISVYWNVAGDPCAPY